MSRTPIRPGATLDLVAGPWDHQGSCRTDVGGVELRVPGLIPGEAARVRVTGRSQGGPVAWGTVERLDRPHPARRDPPCPSHGPCGACPLMHAAEDASLRLRVESALPLLPHALRAALAPVGQWVRSAPWGWRHKAVLLPTEALGRLGLGGFARGTHDVVDLPSCGVLAPALQQARAALVDALSPLLERGLPPAPPGNEGRGLRALVLRGSRRGGVLATAVVREEETGRLLAPVLEGLVERGVLSGAFLQVFDAPGDAVHGRDAPRHLAGAASLDESVGGAVLPVLPLGFFQVNPGVLEGIVQSLAASVGAPRSVLDAYSGAGALGIGLASALPTAPGLTGCDVVPASVEAANAAAARAGLDARYLVGTPADCASEPDLALLDPPRRGCRPRELDAVLATEPAEIAYVSCSPAALGRDAERILAAGYEAVSLVPADMLPQTPHLELVARFRR